MAVVLRVLQKAGIDLKLRDLADQESVGNSPVAETTITESSENSSQLTTATFALPGVNAIFAEDKQLSADMGTWSNLSMDTARILTDAWENEQQGLDDVLSQVEKLDRDDLEEGTSRHVVQALDGLPSAEYPTIKIPDVTVVIFKPPDLPMHKVMYPPQELHVWWKD